MYVLVVGALIFLGILLPFLVLSTLVDIARGVSDGRRRSGEDPALEVLRFRLARGEISEGDFEVAMRILGFDKA